MSAEVPPPSQNIEERLRIRDWARLPYYDPAGVLAAMAEMEPAVAASPLDDATKSLRTHDLRKFYEGRQAAIFCHGMSSMLGTPMRVARVENEDFDCIARWARGDKEVFTPIQLKELAPEHLNRAANIEAELAKLSKYTAPLVVAFHINRRIELDLRALKIPPLKISQLWFYGSASPDGREWFTIGNALDNANASRFTIPRLPPLPG